MAGLWSKDPSFAGGKFLVKRRDGTVPEWPYFVLGARDPAAPAALRAYAVRAEQLSMDPAYVADLYHLADQFEEFRKDWGTGDPDAPRHRTDDPETIAEMTKSRGA